MIDMDKLKILARREMWLDDEEDFNPQDYSGGNFDDAYFSGLADGRTELARDILEQLGEPY